jgi:uncharacterized protein
MSLIIFIRNSALGRVKTRLAADIGDEMALRVYEKLLAYTRAITSKVDCDRYVYYSEYINPEDEWGANIFKKRVQSGPDLGFRMLSAFEQCLKQHQRAVILGSDCAELTSQIIKDALEALDSHDVVVGPALDGGYYLLGLTKAYPELFLEMEWSTEHVAAETIKRATALSLKVHTLPALRDVDTLEDLKAVGWW